MWGDPGAADPFADGDLAMWFDPRPAPPWFEDSFYDGPGSMFTDRIPLDGGNLYISSKTLRWVDLQAAAAAMLIGDGGVIALPTPPRGLRKVGELVVAVSEVAPFLAMPAGAVGHVATYGSETGFASVGAFTAGDDYLTVIRWLVGGADDARVGEHTALVADHAGDTRLVAWQEPEGLIRFVVTSNDVGRQELLALAESVRPATDEEWAALLEMSATPTIPEGAKAAVSGQFSDGDHWAASYGDENGLCIALDDSGTCGVAGQGTPVGEEGTATEPAGPVAPPAQTLPYEH
jgi:hypothetical protein